jgi:deoxyribonucleoside regulator
VGDAKLDEAVRAARLYFLQNMTMEEIAQDMGTSRSTISRLLALAKTEGLIEFRLRTPSEHVPDLERELSERFRTEVHVVPIAQPASEFEVLDQVARTAARLLGSLVDSDMVVGVAWGTTVFAISKHLVRKPASGCEIVQLNGAGNTFTTGIAYASDILGRFGYAFDAKVQQFPVPTLFDFAATRRALWRERSIIRILELQRRCDIMLFSIGAVHGGVPSHVYTAGYLGEADFKELGIQGVVGDVATVFLREDGSHDGISLNERSSGPPPEVVCRAPRRICVVSGTHKVRGLRGAIAAGLITDLIIDERTASALIDSAGPD